MKPTLPHPTRKVISIYKTNLFQSHFYAEDHVNIFLIKSAIVVRPKDKSQQARNKPRQPT